MKSQTARICQNIFAFILTLLVIFVLANYVAPILPLIEYSKFQIDVIGSLPIIVLVLLSLALYAKRVLIKIILFLAFAILVNSFYFNRGLVFTQHGINLDLTAIMIFAIASVIDCFTYYKEQYPNNRLILFLPIFERTTFKETLGETFCLIGLPLFILDLLFWLMINAFVPQGATLGGYGLTDGLNQLIVWISVYSSVLFYSQKIIH